MKKIVSLFFLTTVAFYAHAQLKYLSDGKLTFGNISPLAGYVTAFEGSGHYFHFNNSYGTETWLKINLSATNTRISGNGGYVVFFDDTFQDVYVRNVYTNSDARSKINISGLNNSLQTVMRLRPKTYSWAKSPNADKRDSREIGFIAQEIEQVIPEAVVTDPEGNKLVNYMTVIPLLTGSIQELTARIAALEEEIRILKSK